jgi:hypothetical protein
MEYQCQSGQPETRVRGLAHVGSDPMAALLMREEAHAQREPEGLDVTDVAMVGEPVDAVRRFALAFRPEMV